MMERRELPVVLVIVMVLAVIGFLWGTSPRDYQLDAPLTEHSEPTHSKFPIASTYAQERHATDATAIKPATACTDCHEDKISDAEAHQRTTHPTGVRVPRGADVAALAKLGGRLETDADQHRVVVCRSCHRPHNADIDARLIVTADSGALCLSCHADHSPYRSQHPVNIEVDATTKAAIDALGGDASRGLSCLSCHDLHGSTAGTLLRTDGAGATACRTCHQNQVRALGKAGHGGRTCVECHGMHSRPKHAGKGVAAGEPRDQPCVDCHTGKVANTPQINTEGGHPMWQTVPAEMSDTEGGKTIGCRLCHVAHGSAQMLLTKGNVSATCLSCHADKVAVTGTDHDASVVGVVGKGDVCISCHDVHGADPRPTVPMTVNPATARCLTCHDGRTSAKPVSKYLHPAGLLLTGAGLPFRYKGAIPYFGPDGQRSTDRNTGEIACQTCHDAHRWKHGEEQHPGAADGNEQNSFLRDPDGVVQFCAVCHGNDGLPRFRFYHADTFRDGEDE